MCNIQALLTQSIIREVEEIPDENLTTECVVCRLLISYHDSLSSASFPPEENVVNTKCSKSY